MALPAETTISHYRIISKLGAGGMGEVYLAQDTRLDRKVALKILPEQFTKDESRLRRFVQEAKTASALNHPNIITIHEIGEFRGECGGTNFIATEFIEGRTLREVMTSGLLQLSDALDIVAQVASALAAAHAAGIVHRDIKPENVIVRPDRLVKVLDFGLAKLTTRPSAVDASAVTALKVDTDPGAVMGTAPYMSPEQARGQEIDARTDIFSFGVLVYEMIAGRLPFQGSSVSDVIAAILTREPLPLSRVDPEVPPELARIVSKSLEKDREERYQLIKDLLLDLKRLKKRLEFEAERVRGGETATPTKESLGPKEVGVESVEDLPPKAVEIGAVRTSSSAEHLISGVKRHKVVVGLVLAALLVTIASISYWPAGTHAIDSVAVLPFLNENADPNTEYLADGIPESIINSLSQLPQLKVMSRNSVFRYKGREIDAQEVGKKLGVRAVLTGRVTQRGDGLAISIELVDVRDNSQVWGQQYNRRLADVFAVQEEIAKEIQRGCA